THDESGRRFADCCGGKLDYLRFDQLFELLRGQSNQFSMRACVKCNLLILRQAFIRNVFASSFPGICASAAIPCAVKAGEWEMTMYLTLWLSRDFLRIVSGIKNLLLRQHSLAA